MARSTPGGRAAFQDDLERRDQAIEMLVKGVRNGMPVVPLVGAGISIEAGVPPLLEVTRYLARTKAYLRHRIFENKPRRRDETPPHLFLTGEKELPSFDLQPREYLRDFGWPDPQELNSSLWHWLWEDPARRDDFADSIDLVVSGEILESLWRIDKSFVEEVWETIRRSRARPGAGQRDKWRLRGSYWKILLTQLTRSSPDLVDTLFQRLTRLREPATAHRFFAFLTPVLRLRLFLTINFDTLLEDALRIEGFRPTVYEVADGLSLPHPKLVQEGLSVVKLHGGAYGLLVGDRLDSPLDEETQARFREYLPEHLILLVMGIGGWDQRVLDMAKLVEERQGEVLWLHFEEEAPETLMERFGRRGEDRLPGWLHTARVQDPGAFLREIYAAFKHAHPSSSRPIQVCDLRPLLLAPGISDGAAGKVYQNHGGRLVVYEDDPRDYGLGAAQRLARFVAAKAKTHQPVWVDLETKFTVEDVLVDLIQQLRRYDPGLPPEILVMERAAARRRAQRDFDFRKVVRRLYAALARGRYILAFNGVRSFFRRPTRHHPYEDPPEILRQEPQAYQKLWKELIKSIVPPDGAASGRPESLGLLDSIFAFAIDQPKEDRSGVGPMFRRWVEPAGPDDECRTLGTGGPLLEENHFPALGNDSWLEDPALVLLTAIRRRRSLVALHRLLPKYLRPPLLKRSPDGPGSGKPGAPEKTDAEKVQERLKAFQDDGFLWRLEGGDYWMSRKLRNRLYDQFRTAAQKENPDLTVRIRALATLAFVHQDLAEYHHRDLYVGSQEVGSFLEELYHRTSSLRHLRMLETIADLDPVIEDDLAAWLNALRGLRESLPGTEAVPEAVPEVDEEPWAGAGPIVAGGRLVPLTLIQRRLRGLRALREVLEQEREALLARVASATLEGWMETIREDLGNITDPACRANAGWNRALEEARDGLEELLEDIEVELLQDRLTALEIVELRRAGLARRATRPEGLSLAEENAGGLRLDWLCEEGRSRRTPTLAQLRAWCQGGPDTKPGTDLWERRSRVGRALVDVARALRRSPWEHPRALVTAERFEQALDALLKQDWLRPQDVARREGEQLPILYEPVPPELLILKVQQLRLRADQALWRQSPWLTKGKGWTALVEEQRPAALVALKASDQALKILDSIHEKDRTLRAYFYSLKGRSLYLLCRDEGDFDNAYREFDLARAGLTEASAREREVLAVALLRQAECLMVHSDEALTSWVRNLVRDSVLEDPADSWLPLLSSEGRRKLSLSGSARQNPESSDELKTLLRLSLANFSPEVLDVLERQARLITEHRRELADTLGMMRARLTAARDLLDRVDALLEHSRRKVAWWACLFQLRSQLAVEWLLLLLSGGLSPGVAEPEAGPLPTSLESEDPWQPVRRWLKAGGPSGPLRFPAGWSGRSPSSDPMERSPEARRIFIHRFQGFLRQGLMAVRQGLDVLLPNDRERGAPGRLEQDVLLNRLLLNWTALMVCGSYATNMGREDDNTLDDNVREESRQKENQQRWKQWGHLNWLSSLVIIPRCAEIESWFLDRDWSIGPPSLASRARTLARMALALARPTEEARDEELSRKTEPAFNSGDALEHLYRELRRGPSAGE